MYYTLNSNIALRSWQLVPYAYYIKGERNAFGLKKEEFEFLCKCDGKTNLPDSCESDIAKNLLEKSLISKAKFGDTVSKWSLPKFCDNRYFPAMNWMITGKCNYNCIHCFNAASNAPLMSEWSLGEAKQLIREAAECGINAFTLTGGEPMCHKNFFEITEEIYKHNMFVEELNTNGFYLVEESIARMKEIGCKPLMKISFDGLGYHNWMRNNPHAEQDALRAIRLCIENGLRVKVQTNVNRKNIDAMLKTAELMDSLGVDEMRIIRTTEAPRWSENANGMTLELSEYYDRMLEFASEYIKSPHRMNIDIWQLITIFPYKKAYRLRPVECGVGEYRDSLPVCRGNRGMIAVTANGNVFPCMQMSGYYEAKSDILGNIKTDGLRSIINDSPYLYEVCTTVKALAMANKECGSCPYFKHCVGGCRAIALALTGDKMGSDPAKCLFFKGGYYGKAEKTMCDWKNLLPIESN